MGRFWFLGIAAALAAAGMRVDGAMAASELPQVDGTTGAPLGGIGTGAVKFSTNSGTVYFTDVAATQCGDYAAFSSTDFALYWNRGGQVATRAKLAADQTNGTTYNEDAIYPIEARFREHRNERSKIQ